MIFSKISKGATWLCEGCRVVRNKGVVTLVHVGKGRCRVF